MELPPIIGLALSISFQEESFTPKDERRIRWPRELRIRLRPAIRYTKRASPDVGQGPLPQLAGSVGAIHFTIIEGSDIMEKESKKEREALRVIDLFSGFGGASEAFLQAGDNVMRIENNPLLSEVPATRVMDVQDFTNYGRPVPDLVIACPPCTEFSNGYNGPRPVAQRSGRIHFPSLRLIEVAVRQIEEMQPRYWLIENVVGSIKYLEPYLGKPRQIIGPYVFWGNFPYINTVDMPDLGKGKRDVHSGNPLRANIKACWPLELSRRLRASVVHGEVSLESFL